MSLVNCFCLQNKVCALQKEIDEFDCKLERAAKMVSFYFLLSHIFDFVLCNILSLEYQTLLQPTNVSKELAL